MKENLARKHEIVDAVRQDIEASNLVVLAEYRGVNVAGMSDLRRRARDSNVRIQIVKNTLARRAVEQTDYEVLYDHFVGPIAIAVAEDPVAVAKTVSEFAKDNSAFKIQTGAMNGELLSVERLDALAKLPNRETLLAMLAGTMAAPIQKFVNTLNEIPSGFVRTLAAVRDSKAD